MPGRIAKSYGNTIPILAEPDDLRRAVMSIITDTRPVEEPKDPDRDTVFQLLKLAAPPDAVGALRERYEAGGLR